MGIDTPSVKRQRQRQGPIGMHCDASPQASKLQSAVAANARCGHPLTLCVGIIKFLSFLRICFAVLSLGRETRLSCCSYDMATMSYD